MRRLLLADLGDLDVATVVPALAARYQAAVVTLTLDVGQPDPAASRRARALAAGAIRAHVVDLREAFARDGLLRLLQAGALRPDDLSLPMAYLRTLTARTLLEVSAMEGTSLIAHGGVAGSAASDHLTSAITRQRPECLVVAAGTEKAAHGARPGHAAGCLEGTIWWRQRAISGPAAAASAAGPETTAVLEVAFTSGVPVALNGVEMPLLELIEAADTIAGDHGIGWIGRPPATSGGPASIVEAPAAVVLVTAHTTLTRAAVSATLHGLQRRAAAGYAAILRSGEWTSDARQALDAFFGEAQKPVTGTVRLRLSRGRCRVVGRTVTSPDSASAGVHTAASSPAKDAPRVRLDLVVSH